MHTTHRRACVANARARRIGLLEASRRLMHDATVLRNSYVCLECTSAHVGRCCAVCVPGSWVGVLAIAR